MLTRARYPLLFAGALALAGGLSSGLARLGYSLPGQGLVLLHGPLMVCGFLGTVISLERAVALRRPWGYLAPGLSAAGAMALLAGSPMLSALLATLGSVVVLAILVRVLLGETALHHIVMTVAVVCWLLGNLLWLLGRPFHEVAGYWLTFLVLTIAGERLELSRVLAPQKGSRAVFLLGVVALLAGAVVRFQLLGAGELILAAWLVRFDVARRTIRLSGLPRYISVCLLAGYGWLAVGGVLSLAYGNPLAGPVYDAVLHAVLVGFVFSMIFGHAPIIVPAVLGVRVDFHRRFYAHVALLHAALGARVAGDLTGATEFRRLGALVSAVAIAAFLLNTVTSVRRTAHVDRSRSRTVVESAS